MLIRVKELQKCTYKIPLKTAISYISAGNNSEWLVKWNLPNALLFTLTSVTLIGYGNIAPV